MWSAMITAWSTPELTHPPIFPKKSNLLSRPLRKSARKKLKPEFFFVNFVFYALTIYANEKLLAFPKYVQQLQLFYRKVTSTGVSAGYIPIAQLLPFS
jgi:hypothetical protein